MYIYSTDIILYNICIYIYIIIYIYISIYIVYITDTYIYLAVQSFLLLGLAVASSLAATAPKHARRAASLPQRLWRRGARGRTQWSLQSWESLRSLQLVLHRNPRLFRKWSDDD